jgi:hypothetical protein
MSLGAGCDDKLGAWTGLFEANYKCLVRHHSPQSRDADLDFQEPAAENRQVLGSVVLGLFLLRARADAQTLRSTFQ